MRATDGARVQAVKDGEVRLFVAVEHWMWSGVQLRVDHFEPETNGVAERFFRTSERGEHARTFQDLGHVRRERVHSSLSCVQESGGGTIESVAHTALVLPFALKKRLGPRRRSRARSGSARKPQAPGGRRMGCAIVPLYQPEARCGYLPCRDRSSVRI